MRRIAWATDIHLEFVKLDEIDQFCEDIRISNPDVVLIGGDISVAPTIETHLMRLEAKLQRPTYFVLGNHDFYGGSIAEVRSLATIITKNSRWLHWLSISGVIELTQHTGLIGHDGWADGRLGNSVHSKVLLNDYFLIHEFVGLSQHQRFGMLNTLGDESAEYIKEILPSALKRFPSVLLLTHVPPFKESCWHEGHISDDEFLPHFTCSAVGNVILETMQKHPNHNLTVLCGHTHGQGESPILPNLFVKTGGAEYGSPRIQEVMTVN